MGVHWLGSVEHLLREAPAKESAGRKRQTSSRLRMSIPNGIVSGLGESFRSLASGVRGERPGVFEMMMEQAILDDGAQGVERFERQDAGFAGFGVQQKIVDRDQPHQLPFVIDDRKAAH